MKAAAVSLCVSSCAGYGWLVSVFWALLLLISLEQCVARFVSDEGAFQYNKSITTPSSAPPKVPTAATQRVLTDLGVDVLELLTPTCSQNLLGSNLDYTVSACGNIGRRRELMVDEQQQYQQQQQHEMLTQLLEDPEQQDERALVSCADTPSEQFHWNCFQIDPTRMGCGCNFCAGQVCDPDNGVPSSVSDDPLFYLKQCCGGALDANDTIVPGWIDLCVQRANLFCETLYPLQDPPCDILFFGQEAGPSEFDSAFASANSECNDGGLTLAELTAFFNDITKRNIQQSEVTNLFDTLDVNNDTFVDLDEFAALQGSISRTFTVNVFDTYTDDHPPPGVDSSGATCVLQTRSPTTAFPTNRPSRVPSSVPTFLPSAVPSQKPSQSPSMEPSPRPTPYPALEAFPMPKMTKFKSGKKQKGAGKGGSSSGKKDKSSASTRVWSEMTELLDQLEELQNKLQEQQMANQQLQEQVFACQKRDAPPQQHHTPHWGSGKKRLRKLLMDGL